MCKQFIWIKSYSVANTLDTLIREKIKIFGNFEVIWIIFSLVNPSNLSKECDGQCK
jgi:hypothetical protein